MKNFLIIITFLFIFISCKKQEKYDEHNAKTSLDWTGIYYGVTPCADCPGIETTLTLNSNYTYKLNLVYKEKNVNPFVEEGYFKFDKTGNKITLYNNNKESNKYFVSENYVIQLDANGNFIEGELKDLFKLIKKFN